MRPEQFYTKEDLEKLLEKETDPFFRSYLFLMIILASFVPYSQFYPDETEVNLFLK